MKVQLYKGGLKTVALSGVGQAILHQEKILAAAGVTVTEQWDPEAEVIHLNTVLPGTVVAALRAKWLKKKIVYYGHSTMDDFKNSFKGSNLLAPLFKQWLRFCYRLGNIIITPTPYSRDRLMTYNLKRPIYSLTNGIDTAVFHPDRDRGDAFRKAYALGTDEKVVISVGHFMQRKGILDFIRLAERMPDVRFIWFGHTDAVLVPRTIQRAMQQAPSNLTFAGYVPQDLLRDAYCGADVFAFLSHEETEGIVVLEALACGIPAVVRDIPVYADWLTDGRNAVKGTDINSFEAGIRRLWQDPDFKAHISQGGRATAGERSYPVVGEKLKALYMEAFGLDD